MTNAEVKTCQNCKADFVIEPDDFDFYEKLKVPPPTWCPRCRARRRFVWRNERRLHKRTCDATGKEIFSMFHPSAPVKVYEKDYWWSDKWDAKEYGRAYDMRRTFFEQFQDLLRVVPLYNRSVNDLVNSDYCMNCGQMKDCYLCFNANNAEQSYYCVDFQDSKDCFDCYGLFNCELCYECLDCAKSYRLFYSSDSNACRDSMFLKNCSDCSDCIGCVGLKNKRHHIFNQPYSPEEYEEKKAAMRLDTTEGVQVLREAFDAFTLQFPVKYAHLLRNRDVSGDYIYDSKDVRDSYNIMKGDHCRYCQEAQTLPGSKDCYDYSFWGEGTELLYECCMVGGFSQNMRFSAWSFGGSSELEYSLQCPSSKNLFGCIGLRNAEYCILNKQYSKEEYEALIPEIKKQMNAMPFTDAKGRIYRYGEFFPPEFSPFTYNETLAQDHFPVDPVGAEEFGNGWRESEKKGYQITMTSEEIPHVASEIPDSIGSETIACAHGGDCQDGCSFAFRVVPQEIEFYRANEVPLPRLCFACRHAMRFKKRNPIALWHAKCQCEGGKSHFHGTTHCPNEFETSYAPDRPEIVYCEQCYQAEVA